MHHIPSCHTFIPLMFGVLLFYCCVAPRASIFTPLLWASKTPSAGSEWHISPRTTNDSHPCLLLRCLPSPGAAGDDLALCLRAACWLAPRFANLPSSSGSPRHKKAAVTDKTASSNTHSRSADSANLGVAAPGTRALHFMENSDDERQEEEAGAAGAEDEPLQLLLELGAGHLGAGVGGIHQSLSLMAGALGGGLKSMRVRRAFASSLRAHLGTVQVDSVFRFDAPKNLMASSSSSSSGSGAQGGGMLSRGRLALPPMLNWASFRKYTVTMWVRLDPVSGDGAPATLFRFRNGEGVGVEATLSASTAAASAGAADTPGDVGVQKGQQQQQRQQGRREMVITTHQRSSSKSFSARCRLGPQAEAVHLGGVGGGVGEGVRQGGWRFVVVSHGQPYVKRSGRLRVSVDGATVLDTELQYPQATGQGSKDPMSR